MKVEVLLVVAVLAVAATVAVPAMRPGPTSSAPTVAGTVLRGEVCSGTPCRLLVESDEHTVVDRGTIHRIGARRAFEGIFRYQEEPQGAVLYVYDDVQNLVGRIVNPRSVRLLDAPHALR